MELELFKQKVTCGTLVAQTALKLVESHNFVMVANNTDILFHNLLYQNRSQMNSIQVRSNHLTSFLIFLKFRILFLNLF